MIQRGAITKALAEPLILLAARGLTAALGAALAVGGGSDRPLTDATHAAKTRGLFGTGNKRKGKTVGRREG